jgi:hypothetical protein
MFITDLEVLSELREKKFLLIQNLNTKSFMVANELDPVNISHLIAQYSVLKEGPLAFLKKELVYVSESVREQIVEKFYSVDLAFRIQTLIQNDKTGYKDKICRDIYESVIFDLLTGDDDIEWKKIPFTLDGQKNGTAEILKLPKMKKNRESPPKFTKMERNTLYQPIQGNYPAVDMMFVSESGELVGINVTRQNKDKQISYSAIEKWINEMGVNDLSKVRIAVVPSPIEVDSYKIKVLMSGTKLMPKKKEPSKDKINVVSSSVKYDSCEIKMTKKSEFDVTNLRLELWKLPNSYKTKF